ncbi:thioredoxin fold domain-containing protein [Myxococcota bacterium]|nr:thioredoxin fold domain-containing protein [Myxococcota bacterium]MBU1433179.1 thioredoxin fold domain-containing protein [Myxococcota bacterium]MBU1896196.1 thioredoxin fold domain-containing protein [Myxococcota bacterium]
MDLAIPSIFGAGVLTFFTPCVLPLIPIYLSALVGGDLNAIGRGGRGQLLSRSLFFSAGFILVFSLLGLGAASIGQFLQDHKAAVQLGGALIILIFALKFLGLIRIPFMDMTVRADDRRLAGKVSAVNAFLMGVVFAAGWSPCVGPVLGTVLTYTASQSADMTTGVLYLTSYGLGFAVPLFITAVFAEVGVVFIRKASRYLPIFEKVVGALLLATAGTLLYGLAETASPVDDIHSEGAKLVEAEEMPVMVEFYSSNCPICERMAPIVEGLKYECHGFKVEIRQVDISTPEHRHFKRQFNLVGVPTFVFIDKKDKEVARLVGEQSEQSLRQAISALRGEPCEGVGVLPENYLEKIEAEPAGTACDERAESNPEGVCGEEASDAGWVDEPPLLEPLLQPIGPFNIDLDTL